jgi:hypothetical protein
MRLKLSDLRNMAAMAQFSTREVRADVLALIEKSGDIPGDRWVAMDAKSVQLVPKGHPDVRESVIEGKDVL